MQFLIAKMNFLAAKMRFLAAKIRSYSCNLIAYYITEDILQLDCKYNERIKKKQEAHVC